MRTNIDIDDALMAKAMAASGLRTKKQVVEEALKTFVRLRAQASIRELRGIGGWEGNLDEMRANRFPDRD